MSIFGEKTAVPEGSLAYQVSLTVEGQEPELETFLSSTSILASQSKRGVADLYALAARAKADIDQLTAALYDKARYGGTIDIRVAGMSLKSFDAAEITVADGSPVEVAINIDPGPIFHFGNVSFEETAIVEEPPAISPDQYLLVAGQPAKSGLIVAATEKLIDSWRAAGHPYATISEKDISADHASATVDIRITVDPGPAAVYGWLNVTGAEKLSSEKIAEQSALLPGERFKPSDFKRTRERLRKLESIESVRIIEGEQLDANGGIPVTLEVVERKPRYVGATASVSTIDGAELNAFWGHRNAFGEGEQVRIEGTVSRIGTESIDQIEFNAAALYSKPGFWDIDTDLFSEFRLGREYPDTYESRDATAKIGLAHRFNDWLKGSLALESRFSRVVDAFATNDYLLLSTPGELFYDSRDFRLDPTSGMTASFNLSPTFETLGSSVFLSTRAQLAAYRAVDEASRVVLAGRVMAGTIVGASLSDVPASTRFFAGGGGSVRGYEYRSLGPRFGGRVVGGLSFAGASAEVRMRVTDLFGIVPFVDLAAVSEDAMPKFSDDVYVGAGIGMRYYTALGPLRVDLAVPLTHTIGQSSFGIYVGLGQTF